MQGRVPQVAITKMIPTTALHGREWKQSSGRDTGLLASLTDRRASIECFAIPAHTSGDQPRLPGAILSVAKDVRIVADRPRPTETGTRELERVHDPYRQQSVDAKPRTMAREVDDPILQRDFILPRAARSRQAKFIAGELRALMVKRIEHVRHAVTEKKRRTVTHLKMQMRSVRVAGIPYESEDLSSVDPIAGFYSERSRLQM